MIIIRRVSGNSMLPTLKTGAIIIGIRLLQPKVGRVVIARVRTGEVVKRIQAVQGTTYFLVGDNTHSAHNATVQKSDIIAVVPGK